MVDETSTKEIDLPAVVQRSVQQTADGGIVGGGMEVGGFLLAMAATAADGMTRWGALPKKRDRELRNFWPTENYLAGAIAAVAARNAAFKWELIGDEQSVLTAREMLVNSDYGRGWHHLMVKLSIDVLTQDSGGFIQYVRTADNPLAPVINITHLDASRVFASGVPDTPFYYLDRRGKIHALKWYH